MQRLAEALGMSLPGLKKVFQKSDLSLERFRRICQVLDLDPGQVVNKDLPNGMQLKRLSAAADNYFMKEPAAFALYWCLAVERIDFERARQKLYLSKTESYRFLGKLDHFELLKWESEDKITVPEQSAFLFSGESKAALRFAKEQAHTLVDEAFGTAVKRVNGAVVSMRYLRLSAEELAVISVRLKEEIDKISRNHLFQGEHKSGKQAARVLLCLMPGEMPLVK